jgi:hypothetical protein
VKLLLAAVLVGIVLVGALKLSGMALPILDYPLGGPMQQPIYIPAPDLELP